MKKDFPTSLRPSLLGLLTPKAAWRGRKMEALWEVGSPDQWLEQLGEPQRQHCACQIPKRQEYPVCEAQPFLSTPTTTCSRTRLACASPLAIRSSQGMVTAGSFGHLHRVQPTLKLKSRLQRAGDSFKVDTGNSIQLRKVQLAHRMCENEYRLWTCMWNSFQLLPEINLKRKTNSQCTVQCLSEIFGY